MLRSLLIQVVIFFVAFQGISWVRETSMLSTDANLTSEVHIAGQHLPTIVGDTISLQSKGKKTVVYFFAPWCQVCHMSIENLQAVYEKNEALDVVAVALDYSKVEEVEAFTKQHQLTFPIALGNEVIKKSLSVSGYPSYYVINEENIIIAKSMGYSSELGLYLRSL